MSVTAVTRVAAWPVQRDQGRACHLLSHNLMGSGLSLFAFMTIDIQLNSIVKETHTRTCQPEDILLYGFSARWILMTVFPVSCIIFRKDSN
ncbi:uncharacterized protein LOC143768828 isoform X4 [Ranitomeya variabilis]|uniref:uncharacterized protein LOC143768828 isoform X4 n=1 Tax=Ranitomeya variabilis TaxID=490064 RepID=UPI004057C276